MQTLDRGQTKGIGQGAGRLSRPEWWLIVKDGNGSLEPLTLDGDGGAAGAKAGATLPIFSFDDEAEMFLSLSGLRGHWRVRSSGCGEVVSLLYVLCARTRSVTLDPLPKPDSAGTDSLISLDRARFVDQFLGRRLQNQRLTI